MIKTPQLLQKYYTLLISAAHGHKMLKRPLF